jgi:HIRAN domain-containing protein
MHVGIFSTRPPAPPAGAVPVLEWRLHEGYEDLEVVGEASYQNALWRLCGRALGEQVRHDVIAVLIPEPSNLYDPNAIAVVVDGYLVGYLPRQTAAAFGAGLRHLMTLTGAHVALRGVIVGGGIRQDGPGRLGVWLSHEPAAFGIAPAKPSRVSDTGEMRTGFSEAWRTDAEDDSYDLSWSATLPAADRPAIAQLRTLLADERDPIDRHYQLAELEARLYRARDLYDSALDEFDEACRQHDAEMAVIRQAFMAKWGKVPLLDTYRQMAIRQQKKKDWPACVWWCERGLAVYGEDAAREEAVEDLLKRRNRARAKLGGG